MSRDRISVLLSPKLRRLLEKQAALQGTSESEIVRCYDLALKAGIIGTIKQSSTDLPGNRKHFRG